MAKTVVEILIQHTRIDYLPVSIPRMVRHHNALRRLLLHRKFPVGNACPHFDPLQHFLYHGSISAYGNALITVIKIIIIVSKPQRQALDDKRRQFFTIPAPLLLGISFDQLLINVGAHQRKRLLLQILRIRDLQRPDLLCNSCFGLSRRHHTPHSAESVHIKREIIQLSLIICDR